MPVPIISTLFSRRCLISPRGKKCAFILELVSHNFPWERNTLNRKKITVFLGAVHLAAAGACATAFAQTGAPVPFGLTPNERQIEWYHREQQAFIHFNMNTFTGNEWGTGQESETLFNPTNLDCGQWCRVFKASGITTAILVIKHHDGFCLWPTKYTEHCVRNSPWKSGKGDVLREFTDSCHKYGIKAAIYLSPWDRNFNGFGTPSYTTYYCNQIVELCKDKPYGPLYEIWQDGAGDINSISEADYKKWTDSLHKYMPECVVWSTKKSYKCGDVRWVGNEDGVAGDPCWSTVNAADVLAENGVPNTGNAQGDTYMPAETNVSIRPGWFYHSYEQPKPVPELWDTYFTSTARNTVWLLNFPPDTAGRIPSADSANAAELGKWMYGTFRNNLLAGAEATALHLRGTGFEPKNMVDTCEDTYFASADANTTDTITFTVSSPITFDCIMMQEVIELGHRSLRWSVDIYTNNQWSALSAANNKQCIGYKRAIKFSPAMTGSQVRLRITSGRASPAIHTFGVYLQAQVAPPADWNGLGPVKRTCTPAVALTEKPASNKRGTLRIAGDRVVLPANFAAGPVTLLVSDLRGRIVRRMVLRGGNFEKPFPLPPLQPGCHMISCSSGGKTLTRTLMRLR
jgi:alpha-L-fucosidase